MTDTDKPASKYLVNDLEIDAGTREVRRGAEVLELPGLSFDLLLALVRAAPNVLTHEELEDRVWNGRPVSPETLTQRVKLVRNAVGDSSESPRYITVSRGRGYRLIAPVETRHGDSRRRVGKPAIIFSAMVLLLATVLVATLTDRPKIEETAPIQAPEAASIAVLPFADLSENEDQEHFSEGMSETLIHVLAQMRGLRVIAKSSSFYFKDKDVKIDEIARDLQVAHVLEGSVQRAGNRIRVTAQLIDASDHSNVWSMNFDRDLVDIFAVQDEIAGEVARSLEVTLLDAERDRLAQRYRPSLEAYEQLILGRHELDRNTAESMAAAERHYKRAIEIDPGYALAYVGLANTYNFQVGSADRTMGDSIALRQPLVERALELDPFSSEAYAARAFLHLDRGHLELAENDLLKAIDLNPSYARAHHWYSYLLSRQGRFEETLAQIQVAADLDPVAPFVQFTLGSALWNSGRPEDALVVTRRNIERNPEIPQNYSQMARFKSGLGHVGEAQLWRHEARKRNPQGPDAWQWECIGFLNLGDVMSAETCATQLREAHPQRFQADVAWYLLHQYRGEWNAAVANGQSLLKRLPGRRSTTVTLADLIAARGDLERARHLMAETFPDFLEDKVELAATDLGLALIFAAILHANGETQRREVLLLAMEARIATMHRTLGFGYGPLDTYIHAMRGDRQRAIAGLREAVDAGWKVTGLPILIFWWQLRQDWKLAILHQDPGFIALMDEVEGDIVRQRQWYEENKDKSLF